MPENPVTPPANGPESTAPAAPVVPANGPAATSDNPPGAEALGDAGKRALDAMKAERNAERDKRKALEDRVAQLESAPKVDPRADKRIIRAEIKAAAAGKFANPADVLAFIDTTQFEVSDDGEVDEAKLTAALDELLTQKPYLGVAAAEPQKRFQGTADGGAQGRSTGPAQLTREDLRGMTPVEIAKAKAEGRLNRALGIK